MINQQNETLGLFAADPNQWDDPPGPTAGEIALLE